MNSPAATKKKGSQLQTVTRQNSPDGEDTENHRKVNGSPVDRAALRAAAEQALKDGFCPIITDRNKKCVTLWTTYQKRCTTSSEISAQVNHRDAAYLAIVCGKISGNLEVLDIDVKYDTTGTLMEDFEQRVKEADPELWEKLSIIKTRSGGYHIPYHCETIEGNQPLARRPATPEETLKNPDEKPKVLIETRGERGYVIAPPSAGYTFVNNCPVPTITPEERDILHTIARSFNQVVQDFTPNIKKARVAGFSQTPWEDYDNRGVEHMFGLLQARDWHKFGPRGERTPFRRPGKTDAVTSGDYHSGHNRFKVFTTSSEFDAEKGYSPSAVFAVLECGGDFSLAAKKLAEMGYGQQFQNFQATCDGIKIQKLSGKSPQQIKATLEETEELTSEEAHQLLEEFEVAQGEYICTFWKVKVEAKSGHLKKTITINQRKLEQFLNQRFGIATHYLQKGSNKFIRVRKEGYFLEEISTEQIKKLVKEYVLSLPMTFDQGTTPDELLEVIYRGSNAYFSDSVLDFLDPAEVDLLRDTATSSFFKFRNGVVRVTANSQELLPYDQLGKHVWRNSIKDFDINILDNFTLESAEFYSFLMCICGGPAPMGPSEAQTDRLFYLITLIGYILHKFKDPSKSFAVFLTEETDSEEKGGGTGKGLLFKAIGEVINVVIIDGKAWNENKSFPFQRVELDTDFIALEDTPRNFNFERLYNIVTDGITVEKKNRDEIFIPYSDSPKVGITTNYAVPQGANHSRRRQKIFEFFPFFGPAYTPEMHFGHKLFIDWDAEEWTRFYNLLFCCVRLYLDKGILQTDRSQLTKAKDVKQKFTTEFYEWVTVFLEGNDGTSVAFGHAYADFLSLSEHTENKYSRRKFKSAIEYFCQVFEYSLLNERNSKEGNRHEITISTKSKLNKPS